MLRVKSHLSFFYLFSFLPFKLNDYRNSSLENSQVNLFFSTILLIGITVGEKKGTAFLLLSCYLLDKFLIIDTKVLLKIGSPTTQWSASN